MYIYIPTYIRTRISTIDAQSVHIRLSKDRLSILHKYPQKSAWTNDGIPTESAKKFSCHTPYMYISKCVGSSIYILLYAPVNTCPIKHICACLFFEHMFCLLYSLIVQAISLFQVTVVTFVFRIMQRCLFLVPLWDK